MCWRVAQVEPGEFTVAVGGLEATLTLLPASDVEVHAGDTIPWGMWGQPAGYQLPLPVGPRLCISRTHCKSLFDFFKHRIGIPFEFQAPC